MKKDQLDSFLKTLSENDFHTVMGVFKEIKAYVIDRHTSECEKRNCDLKEFADFKENVLK